LRNPRSAFRNREKDTAAGFAEMGRSGLKFRGLLGGRAVRNQAVQLRLRESVAESPLVLVCFSG
jgi:hypothetical protein